LGQIPRATPWPFSFEYLFGYLGTTVWVPAQLPAVCLSDPNPLTRLAKNAHYETAGHGSWGPLY